MTGLTCLVGLGTGNWLSLVMRAENAPQSGVQAAAILSVLVTLN